MNANIYVPSCLVVYMIFTFILNMKCSRLMEEGVCHTVANQTPPRLTHSMFL